MLTRRHALGFLVGGAAAGLTRPTRAAAAETIRIGCLASEATGGAFYAQDRGFFAKHGVTASISTAVTGPAAASAMLGGTLDVAIADIVVIAVAHDKNLPFVCLAPSELHTNSHPTLAIAVGDSAVKQGSDFNGKTIACSTTRGIGFVVTSAWIHNNGGDWKSLKWIEMPFPAEVPALQRGTIDALVAPEPFISQAVSAGAHMLLLDKKPIAPAILQSAWFATSDWVSKNKETAAAVGSAIREANAWANANPDDAAAILSKYTKIPVDVIKSMKMRGQYQERFDLATIQPLIDGSAQYGLIAKRFPAKDLLAAV